MVWSSISGWRSWDHCAPRELNYRQSWEKNLGHVSSGLRGKWGGRGLAEWRGVEAVAGSDCEHYERIYVIAVDSSVLIMLTVLCCGIHSAESL